MSPPQDEKEAKNEKHGNIVSNSISHTLGARTDDHYFSLDTKKGTVTLHSDVIIDSGRAIVSKSDIRSNNDVFITADGNVTSANRGGLLPETVAHGKLDLKTVAGIVDAMKSAQKSGGINGKEEVALNDLRFTIDTALESGQLSSEPGEANKAILKAAKHVSEVSDGKSGKGR